MSARKTEPVGRVYNLALRSLTAAAIVVVVAYGTVQPVILPY